MPILSLFDKRRRISASTASIGLLLGLVAPVIATAELQNVQVGEPIGKNVSGIPELPCEADRTIDASEIPALVDLLHEPPELYEDFCLVEALLSTGPPLEVMIAILPFLEYREEHSRPAYTHTDLEGAFLNLDDPWPSVEAASRIRGRLYQGMDDAELGALAKALLQRDDVAFMEDDLIRLLERNFDETAEELLLDALNRRPMDKRTDAAVFALMRVDPWGYHDVVRDTIVEASPNRQVELLNEYIMLALPAQLPPDPDIVRVLGEMLSNVAYNTPQDTDLMDGILLGLGAYLQPTHAQDLPNWHVGSHDPDALKFAAHRMLDALPAIIQDLNAEASPSE